MKKYTLYYMDIFLGTLIINEQKQYAFIPNEEGIQKVKDETVLIVEILYGTNGFVDAIPFFQNRINNMEKNKLESIRYHTDYFILKKA